MSGLTEEENIELRAIFDDFDKDANEKLDINELLNAARYFGLNPDEAEVETVKAKHDINEDGCIDFEELKALVNDLYKEPEERKRDTEEAMKTIFRCEDMQEDEKLTKDQFLSLFQKHGRDPLTAEEVDEIFMDLDKDGDTDTITKEEIATLFNS